ncbi:hypothetical protein AGMMS49983_11940 [Clostridia bacterium]|nr:hypothetical protein AGMMS49983_11940 [Clostridia bacterium]
MYCNNCGKEIKDGAKFCPYCGGAQAEAAPPVVPPEASPPPAAPNVPPAAPEYSVPPAVIPDLSRNPAPIVPPASPARGRRFPVWGKVLSPVAVAAAIIIVLIFTNVLGGTGGGDVDPVRTPDVVGEYDENAAGREGEYDDNAAGREAEPSVPLIPKGAKVGDVITIEGTKYYDKTLQWRILDIEEGRALLITEEIIDMRAYNEVTDKQAALLLDENYSYNPDDFTTTWAECSLRAWLNDDFLKDFDAKAVGQILDTAVKNDDNPEYGTLGGADTTDKVFLLSIDEVNKYFASDEDMVAEFHPSEQQLSDIAERIAKNPASRYWDADWYGDAEAAKNELSEGFADYNGAWFWWLRSPGIYAGGAADVYGDGGVNDSGLYVTHDYIGVRPALYLNLES